MRISDDTYALLIAAKIDLLMADQAISQAELARRMETDPGTVCRVLKGQTGMRVSTLCAFLDALGCELDFKRKSIDAKTAA